MNTNPESDQDDVLPEHLLHRLPEHTKWMYRKLSKVDRRMARFESCLTDAVDSLGSGTKRFDALDHQLALLQVRVSDIESFRLILRSKWAVIVLLAGVLWPLILLLLGQWLKTMLSKWSA